MENNDPVKWQFLHKQHQLGRRDMCNIVARLDLCE